MGVHQSMLLILSAKLTKTVSNAPEWNSEKCALANSSSTNTDTKMAKPYAETMQAPAAAPCVNAMQNSLVNTSAALMSLITSTTCSGQPAMVIQCGTQRTTQLTAQPEAVVHT